MISPSGGHFPCPGPQEGHIALEAILVFIVGRCPPQSTSFYPSPACHLLWGGTGVPASFSRPAPPLNLLPSRFSIQVHGTESKESGPIGRPSSLLTTTQPSCSSLEQMNLVPASGPLHRPIPFPCVMTLGQSGEGQPHWAHPPPCANPVLTFSSTIFITKRLGDCAPLPPESHGRVQEANVFEKGRLHTLME